MTTVPAAVVVFVVLSAAGLLPTLALVGLRPVAVPLLPLTGAVVAALGATGLVAVGGTFLEWFITLSLVAALASATLWVLRPQRRPWRDRAGSRGWPSRWPLLIGAVGGLAVLGACAWSLRALATPTVGFDARALWIMRAGWFLQSHQQLLIKMRVPDVILYQSTYPPLVSAVTALAWRVTGDHTARLAVVTIALLNTCALVTAAWALVEAGRRAAARLAPPHSHGDRSQTGGRTVAGGELLTLAPMMVGVMAATLLVFVAFGVTEPFMTNGYADPIWSLAAAGAVAFGLQSAVSRTNQAIALILLLVAGLSKDEGVATAGLLIGLICVRALVGLFRDGRRRHWWRPVGVGVIEVVAVTIWPLVMRVIHARGLSSSSSPVHAFPARARAAYDGMAPYLHVIVLVGALAVVGGVVLSRVRRVSGVAHELWAWLGLASGLVAVGGAFVTGTGAIQPWLQRTVHRVTEFSALSAWWIVAMWAVVASAAPAAARHERRARMVGAITPTPPRRRRRPQTIVPWWGR